MPPRIYEYRLSDLKDFWKRNDNTHISFSVNEEATLAWYNHLGMRMKNRGPKLTTKARDGEIRPFSLVAQARIFPDESH